MMELVYQNQDTYGGLGLRTHPVLRKPPSHVSRPDHFHNGRGDPHILQIAVPLSGEPLPCRIDRGDISRTVGAHLNLDAIVQGSDFYREWVLLHGPVSSFDRAGILVLDRAEHLQFGRPAVIAGPAQVTMMRRSRGDSSYSRHITDALEVVGAQLYLCEKTGLGAEANGLVASEAPSVFDRLTAILLPLRAEIRQASVKGTGEDRSVSGDIGADNSLYKTLLAAGTLLVRKLYDDRLAKAAVGRRWIALGASFKARENSNRPMSPALEHAEDVLRAAVDLACSAFRRDRAMRAVKAILGDGQAGGTFGLNTDIARTLAEAGANEPHQQRVFALTRLAFLWDVNPADIFGGLFVWRLHFAAAQFLGRLKSSNSGEIELGPDAHWGLRAIRNDVFDTMLDPDAATARAWLRELMDVDDQLFDEKPYPLMPAPGTRPEWHFRATRSRRKGHP